MREKPRKRASIEAGTVRAAPVWIDSVVVKLVTIELTAERLSWQPSTTWVSHLLASNDASGAGRGRNPVRYQLEMRYRRRRFCHRLVGQLNVVARR